MVVGSRPEVSETANLMSEVGYHLGADIPPVVGAGTGAARCVNAGSWRLRFIEVDKRSKVEELIK